MSIPLACPVCKAENTAGPACRRCKADLGLLFAIDEQRTALLGQSRQSSLRGELCEALRLARQANDLNCNRESRRWLALMLLLAEDFPGAWQAYQTTENHG
jgi:hypothetical protein